MPLLPERIEIETIDGGTPRKLLIDGKEFPWYLVRHAIVEYDEGTMPTVTITIPAKQIIVEPIDAGTMDLGPEND